MDARIPGTLLVLRLGVFLVMLIWTLDKFVNAAHASSVFANFYGLGGVGAGALAVVGALELLLILAFVAGYQKRWTYAAVFVLHAVSTLSSYRLRPAHQSSVRGPGMTDGSGPLCGPEREFCSRCATA